MWSFKKSDRKLKMEEELLDLKLKIKEKEFDIANKELELKTKESEFRLKMREEKQESDLQMKALRQDLEDQKSKLVVEKSQLIEKHKKEIAELNESNKIKRENDAITLKLEYDKRLSDEINKLKSELVAEREKLNKETYERLSNSLTKLHEEGNNTTKFLQSMVGDVMKYKNAEVQVKTITQNKK